MIKEVLDFLYLNASPEYVELVKRTMAMFDDYDYTDHEQDLLNAVMGPEDQRMCQDIHHLLIEHCAQLLSMHNIVTTDETSLSVSTVMLEGIKAMQFWEDKDALNKILETDLGGEEKFAQLLNEVVGLPTIVALEAVIEFDDAFLKRLSEILQGDLPEQEMEDDLVDTDQVERLKLYKNFIKNDKLIGFRLVTLGYRIGAAFEVYFNKVKSKLSVMEKDELAQEIVVLFLLGRDTWTSPSQAWKSFNHYFELELSTVTAIDESIKRLWSKFDLFSTQVSQTAA